MIQSYSRGRFEYFVVATVIALIMLIALDRYTVMTKEAQVLRLEIISQHFLTAAVTLRTQFLVSHIAKKETQQFQSGLLMDGKIIYLSSDGWPASLTAPVSQNYKPSDEECSRLWLFLLQNPAPITVGQYTVKSRKYRAFSYSEACRYQLVDGDAYFDYFPLTGRLLFSDLNK